MPTRWTPQLSRESFCPAVPKNFVRERLGVSAKKFMDKREEEVSKSLSKFFVSECRNIS